MKYTTQDGFVWTIVTKEQAIELLHSGREIYKVYHDESESLIEMNVQMDDDRGVMFYAVEGEHPARRWARVDSKTGKGMNEGFCVYDGDAYFENESDLIEFLRNEYIHHNGDELTDVLSKGLSDEFILKEAYDNDVYYYTDWNGLDDLYWYEEKPDGTLEQFWKD
jgi:hypothetical protein